MNPNGRDTLLVEGGHPLSGNITPQGAKNEALQVLAAVLLTEETVTLHRLPDILDVRHLIDLLRGLGVQIEDLGGGSMRFTAKDLDATFLEGDCDFFFGVGLFVLMSKKLSDSFLPCRNYFWIIVNLVELYPDSMSKIALALTGAQLAKNINVEEFGVGEDLAFNFFALKKGELLVVAQLQQSEMNKPVESRIPKCGDMLATLKTFWGIDAVTLVAEGFETHNKEKLQGRDC